MPASGKCHRPITRLASSAVTSVNAWRLSASSATIERFTGTASGAHKDLNSPADRAKPCVDAERIDDRSRAMHAVVSFLACALLVAVCVGEHLRLRKPGGREVASPVGAGERGSVGEPFGSGRG
jgi:hypothetical protein